jgi:hypothetical protein
LGADKKYFFLTGGVKKNNFELSCFKKKDDVVRFELHRSAVGRDTEAVCGDKEAVGGDGCGKLGI